MLLSQSYKLYETKIEKKKKKIYNILDAGIGLDYKKARS